MLERNTYTYICRSLHLSVCGLPGSCLLLHTKLAWIRRFSGAQSLDHGSREGLPAVALSPLETDRGAN